MSGRKGRKVRGRGLFRCVYPGGKGHDVRSAMWSRACKDLVVGFYLGDGSEDFRDGVLEIRHACEIYVLEILYQIFLAAICIS